MGSGGEGGGGGEVWGAWEAENMHAQRGINNISESKSPAGVIDYLPFDLMLYRGKGGTRLGADMVQDLCR